MISMIISTEMIEAAKAASEAMGKLRNSITSGEGNLAGFIGEEMVASFLGAKRDNTYDYDLIFNGIKIDVKTKRTTVVPQDHYECSVADFNTKQNCDWYVFTRVANDASRGWILGFLPKAEFYERAAFRKAGELDTANNFVFKADCYNIPISMLRELEKKDVVRAAPPIFVPASSFDWLYSLRRSE
jgi:hypothetical protein